MTINPHAQAVLDLLGSSGSPALTVLDGYVPNGTVPPYVLVYFQVSSPTAEQAPDATSLTFDQTRVAVDAYCHSVGGNGAAARAVSTRVRTALLNVRPTVATRTCTPLRLVDNQPPQRDESAGLVFDQIDVYRFQSEPA